MSPPPRVAISMGDPTGIGPEVTLRALARRAVRAQLTPILVGDPDVFAAAAAQLGLALRLVPWAPPAPLPARGIAVYAVAALRAAERRPGKPSAAGGRAAHASILAAVELVQRGGAEALTTAPICKANLVDAGLAAVGHTELLAALAGDVPVRMMLVGGSLRVALATTHLAIARVPGALSRRLVLDTIAITARALREQFGLATPHLAVTGLNPHAGEGGLFGDEEARHIAPAIRDAVRRGIRASGPHAADSAFPLAAAGRFDAVVCMYHDQGLAPFKLVHFADGVNFTAGLPFVRTSPDHGTAHDIAGQGRADARSMAAALSLAARLGTRSHTRRARRAA